MPAKPRVFIGSSSEREEARDQAVVELASCAEAEPWDADIFKPGLTHIESLCRGLGRFDFAVFIFAPDDTLNMRGLEHGVTRDNVLFELGLFVGHLGRERCFILVPEGVDFHLPLDLLGVVLVKYDEKTLATSGMRPAIVKVRRRMTDLGRRPANGARDIVSDLLESLCRAVSAPHTVDLLGCRAFVFRKMERRLVCTHHWAVARTQEMVGVAEWPLPDDKDDKRRGQEGADDKPPVAVVRAVQLKGVQFDAPKPAEQREIADAHAVSDKIRAVLAAPIFDTDGRVWGVVDIDVCTEAGKEVLESESCRVALFALAQSLREILAMRRGSPGA